MKKVLLIHDKPLDTNHNFIDGFFYRTLPKDKNLSIKVIGFGDYHDNKFEHENLEFIRIGKNIKSPLAKNILYIFKIYKYLRKKSTFDFVIIRNIPAASFIFNLFDKNKTKFIFQISHFHSETIRYSSRSLHALVKSYVDLFFRGVILKKIDTLLVVSETMKEEILKRYKFDREKIFVMPLGINRIDFQDISTDKVFDLVYLGTVNNIRKLEVILSAVKHFNDNYGRLKINIWPNDNANDISSLQRKINILKVSNLVSLHKNLPRKEALSILKKSKISLVTIPYNDVLKIISPIKLVESIASRTIVLGSYGIKEIETVLNNMIASEMVEFKDTEISKKINYILNSYESLYRDTEIDQKTIFELRDYDLFLKSFIINCLSKTK